ncbi:MAG: glycosyltransferase family 4 protein [Mariniphaga sp.]|nr:glycosyltransferase family 4 protein [Mariniphaga sp.]
MKKILIDGRLLSDKPTGISRYTKEVIKALIDNYKRENVFVLVDKGYTNNYDYNIITTKLKPYNPFHFIIFSLFVGRLDFPIYYSPFYSGLYFKDRKKKQVITVHDLMYLRITNYFSGSKIRNSIYTLLFNFIVKSSIRSSNLVVSVSKTTKDDLLKYFKTDSVVIGEGINFFDEKPSLKSDIFDRLRIRKEKYFLYVGNFRRQKNIPFLIEAFIRSNTSFQLVLVGDNKFKSDQNKNIIYPGVLEDHEIQTLYRNCLAFVMPSLYEGFGLPILEAYNAGARILSSNQGSLAEFQNLGIHYFSPFNQDELVLLLQNIENFEKPTEQEISRSRKTYSWKNQTDKIIDSIESLISR